MLTALLLKIKNKIIRKLINYGIIRSTHQSIGGKQIIFSCIHKSQILKKIACFGWESFEPELVKFLVHYPFEIKTFIDGGANVGFFSVLSSIFFGNSTKTIAVEPYQPNIDYIRYLSQHNKLDIQVIEKALYHQDNYDLKFYVPIGKNNSSLSAAASLINRFQGTGNIYTATKYREVDVKTISLDTLLSRYELPALVKLDCEGVESIIIQNCKKLINSDKIDFIIEMNSYEQTVLELFNFLKSNGYSSYLMTTSGLFYEEAPLIIPNPEKVKRTGWMNHFFTKNLGIRLSKCLEIFMEKISIPFNIFYLHIFLNKFFKTTR